MEDFDISKIKVISQDKDPVSQKSCKCASTCNSLEVTKIRREKLPRISSCDPKLLAEYVTTDQLEKEKQTINEEISQKQNQLEAGENIQIKDDVISATDTTYTSSDFDIKDLSDTNNLRQIWSNKQNTLVAEDNIIIQGDHISAVDTIYDDTEVKNDISNLQENKQDNLTAGNNIHIEGSIISAIDTIYDDTEVRELIDSVDQKVDSLDEFTCGAIVPTTTNFVEGTDYTIHESLQRTANLFEGQQGEIDDINDLIPNQATNINQLADKAFVNSTVATNAANFRGNWTNFTSVPSNVNDYPADYSGSKIPTNNDYLVVQDGTDYDPSNTGMWRFIYVGDWSIAGKSGWTPQYRVGSAFTAEQLNAINSGITSQKVSNYDNYRQEIDDLFPLIVAGL